MSLTLSDQELAADLLMRQALMEIAKASAWANECFIDEDVRAHLDFITTKLEQAKRAFHENIEVREAKKVTKP